MRTLLALSLLPSLLCLSATVPEYGRTLHTIRTGNYGVCGCADNAAATTPVVLTVREDGTFRFVDHTDTSHFVDVSGQWRLEGSKLLLTATGASPRAWTCERNSTCLRTRTGMKFRRLCLLEDQP